MKKTISFEKKIEFPSMIGEITAISLDHSLKFIDNSNIEGEFIVSGTYKLTEASRIEEDFSYKLPAEIILSEKLDLESAKIDIDDFYYEIENDYTLICYIDVKVEGVEVIDIEEDEPVKTIDPEPTAHVIRAEEEKEELKESPVEEELRETTLKEDLPKLESISPPTDDTPRECDGDLKEETTEYEVKKEETMETKQTTTVSSLFENINESEETYATYSVYILREEETVNSLIEKYKTTKEELENYNDLSNLSIGSKIIIPLHEE